LESNPEGEYCSHHLIQFSFLLVLPISASLAWVFIVLILLIICSGIVSGSEVAFFSLNAQDKEDLSKEEFKSDKRVLKLLEDNNYLLATILIGNNFFNIAVIILSYFSLGQILDFGGNALVELLVNTLLITFIIVLFGEIIPKIFARSNRLRMARLASLPLILLYKIALPLSFLLVNCSNFIQNRVLKNSESEVDIDEIEDAIDLTYTEESLNDDNKILKGIINFGNITVKQIMKARVDMVAIDEEIDFEQVYIKVIESGYSRIPVYKDDLDDIVGILYAKDILEYLTRDRTFNWKRLLRKTFFVPETKKIDDLLREFQKRRTHLAIVIDEFGGTMGLITMEDVLEEVLGEIQEEYDAERDIEFEQIDINNYTFEGKTLLNDIRRVLEIDNDIFEDAKGDADSLAGLILELTGKMPKQNEQIIFEHFTFDVLSVSEDRIEKVKVTIADEPSSLVS